MIINYRIERKQAAPGTFYVFPYHLIRYGSFGEVDIDSFGDMDDAEEALNFIRREMEEVKELEHNDTVDFFRRELHRMLPVLDAVKSAGDDHRNVMITAALEEAQQRLSAANVLALLWDSTDELHHRFDKFPPKSRETLLVFVEEARELVEATQFYERFGELVPGTDRSITHVCLEAADVLVTVFATLSALGISREQFMAAAQSVAAKNDAKTHDTHFVNPDTGKITRRKED